MLQTSGVRRVVGGGLHPFALVVGVWLAALGLSWGVAPPLITLGGGVFAALCCIAGERLLPFEPSWRRSHGDVAVDLAHFFCSMIAVIALFQWLAFGPLAALGRALGLSLWPGSWPLWGQLLLALVIAELGYYWAHRLGHEVDFLWRLHAAHHSVPRLYWFNSGHFHPLDTLLNYAAEVTPLLLLGAGPEVLVLFSVFTTTNGMLKHSNIALRLGVLNWVLSTAELHRWHHSKEPSEGNTNYGSNLVLWDLLFRTRFLPDRPPPTALGLSGLPQFPTSFAGQLRAPFEWERVARPEPPREG